MENKVKGQTINGVYYEFHDVDAEREVDALKSQLKYNSYDLLRRYGTFSDRTGGGVAYTWNADHTVCTAVGTTTALSICNIYDNALPNSAIKAGDVLRIQCETSDANLLFEVLAYAGGTLADDVFITEDRLYKILDGTTRLVFRIRTRYTPASTTTVNATISVGILNAKTNKELEKAIDSMEEDIAEIDSRITRQYMQIFPKYTTIGDSLMGGFMNRDGVSVNTITARDAGNNWVNYIALRTGRTFINLAVGGSTAKQWRESFLTNANVDTDCYIVGIGVNDCRQGLTIGSLADIASSFSNNSDSFYGNYDYILRQLMAWKPNSHIFCFTIPPIESDSADYNTAIRAVTALYPAKVHCIDLAANYAELYNSPIVTGNYTGGHFNPVAYNYMSVIVEKAINDFVENNDSLFATAPYA